MIHIEESGQKIILKPNHGEPNLRSKEGVLVFSANPLGDLNNAVIRHREDHFTKVWPEGDAKIIAP